MKTADSLDSDVPLYASCRELSSNAPLRWLKNGWRDFQRAIWHSLTYGVIFACMGWTLAYLALSHESYFLGGLLLCLLLVGPALAFGLYDISQQLELNQKPTFRHERMMAIHELGHELMLALLLSLMFLVLLILISMVTNIGAISGSLGFSAAVAVSDTVSLSIAVVSACVFFCATAFALPMILDQDANAMTAIITSFHAVWLNKSVIALWTLLILALTAVGIATALIGFVVIAPVLGYATWHAYRELIVS